MGKKSAPQSIKLTYAAVWPRTWERRRVNRLKVKVVCFNPIISVMPIKIKPATPARGVWQVVPIVACVASISVETDRGTRGFYFWPRVKWNERQKINDGGGEGEGSERTRKVLTFLPHHSLLFSSRHFSRGLLLSFLVLCSETKMALNKIFLFILKLQKTEYLFKVLFLLRKLRRA